MNNTAADILTPFTPFIICGFAIALIFPLITLIQTWVDREASLTQKILWTVGTLFTWTIAAAFYGLFKYRGVRKLIPLIVVAAGFFAYMSYAQRVNAMIFYGAKTMVQVNVKEPQIQRFVMERLENLEVEKGYKNKRKNFALAAYMITLISDEDKLTQVELRNWAYVYNKRDEMSADEINNLRIHSE